jgi:cell wall assembly regulator SMI1
MQRRTFLASSMLASLSAMLASVSLGASGKSAGADEDLRKSFEKIRRWLGANAPRIRRALRAPVTSRDLSALERSAGTLPKDLIALYRWHDGIDPKQTANLFFGMVFESAAEVVRRIQRLDEARAALNYADPGIDASYGLASTRIPIGNDAAHCYLCVDLAPTQAGRVGQVILIDEEYRVGLKLCDSVSELVASFARDLEEGKYTLAQDAREAGDEWLDPERSIDPVNWFNSPTWARAHGVR